MRALVVAPEPFFSPRGTPFSVYYRTLVLAELGVEVDLLTYGQGQDVDLPGVRIVRIPALRFLGPVKVGPSLLKLVLDGPLLAWTVGMLLRRRYDFVHAHEESVFFCRFLKPLFRFALVYDMHSSLPQQLTNFKFTRSRLLIRLFEALEDSCLRRADAVITISPALAEYALARMPDPHRHFLIENSIFEPVRLAGDGGDGGGDGGGGGEDGARWRGAIPADRPVIAYAGTFEAYQGLDILIPAFARVRQTRPDAFLLLVGGEPAQVERFRRLAAEEGLDDADCLFTGQLPPAAARQLMRGAAVLTSPRSEGTNTPLKIYEQLASGTPLVATRIHSHTQVLDDEVCFLADPEPAAMARAIVSALEDRERRRQVVANAQALYRRRYAREAYERKMRALLEVLR